MTQKEEKFDISVVIVVYWNWLVTVNINSCLLKDPIKFFIYVTVSMKFLNLYILTPVNTLTRYFEFIIRNDYSTSLL